MYAIVTILCCIIPLSELIHFSLYHVTVSESSIFAVQETDYQEALGYLQTYISPAVGISIIFVFLLIGFLSYRATQLMPSLKTRWASWFVIILLPITVFYIVGSLKDKTLFFSTWQTVTAYRHEQKLFAKDYDARYQALQITTDHTLAKDVPGTVIMVIGESASRDYMTYYTPSLPYDDTPWMESQKSNPNFIIYSNVYACYNQTVEALIRACTEMSQYNDKRFNESISIVDVAKKAGYQTYWLSNQGSMGENDAPITLMMKTADHYAVPNISDRLIYDGDLLPLLKNIDKNQSNFIVIHLKGSHVPYQKRYPESHTQFDSSTPEGQYANTILYTDTVLHDIFTYAQQNLNLKAMVYFSDHGENIYHGHGPDVRTFDTLRIPMFIYLSPDYQQYDPSRYNILKKHQDAYFTNDMIYNTISGILEAPSNHYDSREDFSSPDYDFQRDTLWTFKHTVPISEDPT